MKKVIISSLVLASLALTGCNSSSVIAGLERAVNVTIAIATAESTNPTIPVADQKIISNYVGVLTGCEQAMSSIVQANTPSNWAFFTAKCAASLLAVPQFSSGTPNVIVSNVQLAATILGGLLSVITPPATTPTARTLGKYELGSVLSPADLQTLADINIKLHGLAATPLP